MGLSSTPSHDSRFCFLLPSLQTAIECLSKVRDSHGVCSEVIIRFLIDLVHMNDNEDNRVS